MTISRTKPVKILHLASFSGNIGDTANHSGFYMKLASIFKTKITQLEIRKFYLNRSEAKFDNTFIDLVNNFDLLVLGGGGFFDLKWDYSHTGTTINLSAKMIRKIKIPVLVNAMGYHEYNPINSNNISKFHNFLKEITNNDKWFITLRNDGSFGRMKKRYGNIVDTISVVPDNGFAYHPGVYDKLSIDKLKTTWIGLNITNELFSNKINVDTFNKNISLFINELLSKNNAYKIILFPHAYQDIVTIGKIIAEISDKFLRERIIIAPLLNSKISIEHVFDLYRICTCVVAMRFHGNVCCLAMNVPTIGLSGHDQISALYDELGIPERCIRISTTNLVKKLETIVAETIYNQRYIKRKYASIHKDLDKLTNTYMKNIRKFVEQNIYE